MPAEPQAENEPAPRRIWLCADDYGISPSVSKAIRDLIMMERLNATPKYPDAGTPFELLNKVLTECQSEGFRKFALRAMNKVDAG